jgi:hypothetical protein
VFEFIYCVEHNNKDIFRPVYLGLFCSSLFSFFKKKKRKSNALLANAQILACGGKNKLGLGFFIFCKKINF